MNETFAAITWSSTDDTVNQTERVHYLTRPFTVVNPAHNMVAFSRESLDKTKIESIVVGDGAYELLGVIDLEQDGHSAIDMLKAGTEGKTLTYYPDLGDADVNFACDLISPRSPVALQVDPKTGGFRGDHTLEVRLRQTDQGSFHPLNKGKDVVFWYRAGDSLDEATYTRADTATRTTKGFGQLSTAASGIARVSWFSSESTGGPRMKQALWLEDARTNLITESGNLAHSTWTNVNSMLATSSHADPYGGTNMWLIGDNNSAGNEYIYTQPVLPSTLPTAVSVFVAEGSTTSTGQTINLRNETFASLLIGSARIAWSSGVPTLTVVTGSTYASPEQFAGGRWRVGFIADGTTEPTDEHRFEMWPADSTGIGDLYVFGPQVE